MLILEIIGAYLALSVIASLFLGRVFKVCGDALDWDHDPFTADLDEVANEKEDAYA